MGTSNIFKICRTPVCYSTTKVISSLKNIYCLVVIFSNSKENKLLPFELVPSPGNRYTSFMSTDLFCTSLCLPYSQYSFPRKTRQAQSYKSWAQHWNLQNLNVLKNTGLSFCSDQQRVMWCWNNYVHSTAVPELKKAPIMLPGIPLSDFFKLHSNDFIRFTATTPQILAVYSASNEKKLLNNGIFQQGTLYFTLHNMCVHIHKYNSW